MGRFLEIVSLNYEEAKSASKRMLGKYGMKFNEDIFTETLLKCDRLHGMEYLTEKEISTYFLKALKNNSLTEIRRNRKFASVVEETVPAINTHYDANETVVHALIKDKYGEYDAENFIRHAYGEKYKDIGQGFNKDRYREIRQYLKSVLGV